MEFIMYYELKDFYNTISTELSKILSFLTLNEFCEGYNKDVIGKEYAGTFYLIMDDNSIWSVKENIDAIFQKMINNAFFYCKPRIKFETSEEFVHPKWGKAIPIKIYFKVMKQNPKIIGRD